MIKKIKSYISNFINEDSKTNYFVNSLYFDNDNFDLYHDTRDGIQKRFKFRIRAYESSDVFFLEKKIKKNNIVFKHRSKINNDFNDIKLVNKENIEFFNDFLYLKKIKILKPKIFIKYQRDVYLNDKKDFKITFDKNLSACIFKSNLNSNNFINFSNSLCVMEIKFKFKIPFWFDLMLRSNNLKNTGFSKMCAAVEFFNLKQNEGE